MTQSASVTEHLGFDRPMPRMWNRSTARLRERPRQFLEGFIRENVEGGFASAHSPVAPPFPQGVFDTRRVVVGRCRVARVEDVVLVGRFGGAANPGIATGIVFCSTLTSRPSSVSERVG